MMRQIFGILGKPTRTIREEMSHKFSNDHLRDGEVFIQVSETSFRRIRCSPDDQLELGYRQVWLGVLREWEKLCPGVLKKERERKTPRPQKPNAEKWYSIGGIG